MNIVVLALIDEDRKIRMGHLQRCQLLRLPQSSAYRVCRTVEIAAALALWGGAVYLSLGLSCGIWPLFIGAMFLYRAAENAFSDS